MKVIIDEGLYDAAKAASLQNFHDFVSSLFPYTLSAVSGMTGLSEDEIVKLARSYAASRKRLIALTANASENTTSLNTLLAAANLVLLLGDAPETLQIPAEFSNTLGMWMTGVRPLKGGKDVYGMFYEPNEIKALYVMGENPLVSFPDTPTVEKRLKGLELLIVQDIFLTETAKVADVVLPASSWAEKEGTFMSATGTVQKITKIVSETGESIPDWMIFRNLARIENKDLGKGIDEIRRQMAACLPEDGRKGLKPAFTPLAIEAQEKTTDAYPLFLVTASLLQHSGALSVLSKNLGSVASHACLQINSGDAKKYHITHDGFVRVKSRRGEVYLKALVTDEIPEGTVFAPVHFAHAKVNVLTYPSANGGAPLAAVRVEAAT
jgi:predicted molibdopterin-dependent oxidoreductase YjgC